MNTKQIQFNRQWMIALLLAGLILALTAGLPWAGADNSGSTFQEVAEGGPGGPGDGNGQSAAAVDCPGVAGSKLGSGTDGVNFRDCESEVLPVSLSGLIAGGRGGIFGDC